MEAYLKETKILDYSNPSVQKLINEHKWNERDTVAKVKSIYNYVRDEIKFGYNVRDDISASQVLADGYGQCNTKSTLLMALLRATGVPNRLHGFIVNKALQEGAITGIWYRLSPRNILHTWTEVYVNNVWYSLEGVILDKKYLGALQNANPGCSTFCGFGVYTDNFKNPEIEWNLNNTYIQHKGIIRDLGIFETPDHFYAKHKQQLNFIKQILFERIIRHKMNNNVERIRSKSK